MTVEPSCRTHAMPSRRHEQTSSPLPIEQNARKIIRVVCRFHHTAPMPQSFMMQCRNAVGMCGLWRTEDALLALVAFASILMLMMESSDVMPATVRTKLIARLAASTLVLAFGCSAATRARKAKMSSSSARASLMFGSCMMAGCFSSTYALNLPIHALFRAQVLLVTASAMSVSANTKSSRNSGQDEYLRAPNAISWMLASADSLLCFEPVMGGRGWSCPDVLNGRWPRDSRLISYL